MANLIDRVKLAAQVLRTGQSAAPRPLLPDTGEPKAITPLQRKAQGDFMMFPSWMNGQPQWQFVDIAAYVREGFEMNTLIYSAVMYKARAAVTAPLRAYTGDIKNPTLLPPEHRLSTLLQKPNPTQSWAEFTEQQVAYLNISGNSFTYLQRSKDGAFPTALWNLRPDYTWIVPGSGTDLKGYIFRPYGYAADNGLPILPSDMMHVKFPNPGDPMMGLGYGLSPLMPMAQSGDVDNEVTRFLKMFFQNKAMVGGLLKYETSLDDTMVAEARTRWQEIYGGVDNWGAVAVLDKSASYERIGLTFEEMGFSSLDERNETRILSPFGVPAILIGAGVGLKYGTYSNFETARRAFWEDTFIAELKLFESDYQYYLSSDDGSFPIYDLSGVPALQQNIAVLVDAATKLFNIGTPRNLAFSMVGLKAPETIDGDVGYLPFGVQPIGTPRTAPALPDGTTPPPAPTDTVIEDSTTDETTPTDGDVLPNATDDAPKNKAKKPEPQAGYVYLSLSAEKKIVALQDVLKAKYPDVQLIDPKLLHLTLAYAEDVNDAAFLAAYKQSPDFSGDFWLLGKEFIVFDAEDNDTYPVVLEVKLSANLKTLQAGVKDALKAQDVTVSEYTETWRPHITLGYADKSLDVSALDGDVEVVTWEMCWSREDYEVVYRTGDGNKARKQKKVYSEEEKSRIWKAVDKIAEDHEDSFGKSSKKAFEGDKRAILALVHDAKQKSLQRKASIDWLDLKPEVTKYFYNGAAENWKDQFAVSMTGLLIDTGEYWAAQTGFAFNTRNLLGESWFSTYQLEFSKNINQGSMDVIHDILAQGAAEGWSIPTMQEHLTQTFTQWADGDVDPDELDWITSRMPSYRTEAISRTESMRLENNGATELFRAWNVSEREWLSTRDERCRDAHLLADGQVVGIDEKFDVGGEKLDYPGDPNGDPSNVINCRCTTIPKLSD